MNPLNNYSVCSPGQTYKRILYCSIWFSELKCLGKPKIRIITTIQYVITKGVIFNIQEKIIGWIIFRLLPCEPLWSDTKVAIHQLITGCWPSPLLQFSWLTGSLWYPKSWKMHLQNSWREFLGVLLSSSWKMYLKNSGIFTDLLSKSAALSLLSSSISGEYHHSWCK